MKLLLVCTVIFMLFGVFSQVSGNAFLKSPTSRSSVWRYFGHTTWKDEALQNTEDMMLNCGGAYTNGNLQNKCGLCGDPFNGPRDNEGPNGKYAIERPSFIYYEGEEINVTVQVTARANGGFFQFKLCQSDATTAVTQACFDATPLRLAGTTDQTLIQIPDEDGDIVVPLQLPAGVTCDYCVMQWVWVTARDWRCDTRNGRFVCGMGYGEQPTYVNCADFRILSQGTPFPADFVMPDYNSEYASIFGGHGGESQTTAATTESTTQIQVVTTPTTPIPIITSPVITPAPSVSTQSNVATTPVTVPSTSQIIIITPSRGTEPTTPAQATTPQQSQTTTTMPGLTTEKLVPAIIGGGGVVAPPLFGLGGLTLGLGGLGLLMGMMGGKGLLGGAPPAPSPILQSYSMPVQPVGFAVPQPFMAPFPTAVSTYEEISVGAPSYPKSYGRVPTKPYRPNYSRKVQVGTGYGKTQVRSQKMPSYNAISQPARSFFELPKNYVAAPVLGYAKEPDVEITKEKVKKESAYSSKCPAYEQTCKPRYNEDSTLYGKIHIFGLICELECLNGKAECPVETCACTCPNADDSSPEAESLTQARGNVNTNTQTRNSWRENSPTGSGGRSTENVVTGSSQNGNFNSRSGFGSVNNGSRGRTGTGQNNNVINRQNFQGGNQSGQSLTMNSGQQRNGQNSGQVLNNNRQNVWNSQRGFNTNNRQFNGGNSMRNSGNNWSQG